MITDTTFTPDMGLDFKLPPFLDVQQFLGKAQQTGQIMVGQPNMEFISKQFKIYTYSVLDDKRYWELGFIDPDIYGYFQRLIRYLSDRADARITIFFELWDKILAPMTLTPESATKNKLALFKQNETDTQYDRRAFRQVNESLQQDWTLQYCENLPAINASGDLPVSISIGIYVFDSSLAPTWGAAYQRADTALYTAKDKARNRVVMVLEDTPLPDNAL